MRPLAVDLLTQPYAAIYCRFYTAVNTSFIEGPGGFFLVLH